MWICKGPITHIAFKAIDTDYAQVGPDGVPGTGDDGRIECLPNGSMGTRRSTIEDYRDQ